LGTSSFKPLSGIGCVATIVQFNIKKTYRRKFQTPFGNWVRCNDRGKPERKRETDRVSNPFRELGALQLRTITTTMMLQNLFQTPFGNWVRCNVTGCFVTGSAKRVSNPFRELGALQPLQLYSEKPLAP